MPAPAVIPAPIVYFKVVAVKTLVVNLRKSFLVRADHAVFAHRII